LLTLSDRLKQHALGLQIDLERFISVGKEHRNRCAFRKFRVVQFNSTADDPARSNSHHSSIRHPLPRRRGLEDLRVTAIGLEPPKRKSNTKTTSKTDVDDADHLTRQLRVLKTMFDQKKDDDFYANFEYATQRALFTMKNRRASEFGDIRVYSPDEMLQALFAKSNSPTTLDWTELE
jgi:hypothetical protein